MIKAIVFDWHGVLDFTTFEDLVVLIAKESNKSKDEIKQIFRKIKNPLIRGEGDISLLWNEINNILELSEDQLQLIQEYILKIEKNQELFDFLEKLNRKYKFAILSDCSREKAERIKSTIDLNLFSPVIFSCDVGKTKSEDDFFEEFTQQFGVEISEILYVDDTEKHIEKTKALGFQVYHFTDNQLFINYINSLI